MITIPERDRKFSQTNRSNILGGPYNQMLGNLWSTFGIDLQDNIGAIRIGQRMKVVNKTGDSNCTNLGISTAFTPFLGNIFCIGGSRIFYSNGVITPAMAFKEDTSTNVRTDWSADSDDLCLFNGALCGINCAQEKIYSLNSSIAGSWSTRASVVGSGTNGQLATFQKFNRLYVANGKYIHSVDTSWNITTTGTPYDLTLTGNDDGGEIQCIAPSSDRIWIGMRRNAFGGTSGNDSPAQFSSIYEWDGISNQVTKEYKIPALGTMAIVIRNDIPIIMDTNGVLREFNNQGFKEIGRLPLRRNQSLLSIAQPSWSQNFIHPKGLAVTKENTIIALINNRTVFHDSAIDFLYENLPSGIWEFDGNGSAVMKHPITAMPVSSTTVTDHGQNRVAAVGSLALIPRTNNSAYGISSIFAGVTYYTDASSTTSAIMMDAPWPTDLVTSPEGQKYGYFTTPFILSPNVTETWQKIFVSFRKFLASTDKLVVKYRLTDPSPTEISITWVNTTSFTTSTDMTSYVGYEVEILQGIGSGKCSHITTVVNNSGTYTVTVDETYTGATTTTAKARVQNWIKCGSYGTQALEYLECSIGIGKNSPRIQFKVCLQCTGDDEIYEMKIANVPERKVQ